MWEITVKSQLLTFLFGVVIGAVLSLYFDSFRTLRRCFRHNKLAVFLEDILFFIVSAFVAFMFLMARCNGEVRAYVIFSLILGFMLYRITISRLLLPICVFAFRFAARIIKKIGLYISKFISHLTKNAKKQQKK